MSPTPHRSSRVLYLLLSLPLALIALSASFAATPADDDTASLRLVANHVLTQTTRHLIDRETGRTYDDSTGLAPKASLSIESKFNAWFYQTALLADGMNRAATVLDDPALRDYGERNLDFIARHLDYFTRQHAAGLKAAPVGDGSLSPIGFYFDIKSLWHTGLAPLVLEHQVRTGDTRHVAYLARLDAFLEANPRFPDGAYYRPGKGLMTDDPYMTVPYLVRKWRLTGDTAALDRAIAQITGTATRLFDADRLAYRHLWDLKTKAPRGELWARGNGWMVLATVELLAALPCDHPRRAEVLALFNRQAEGLRRWQDTAGGWHQVLDHPESWIETSGTAMFTYGLARGVNEGWLDRSFADHARRGWQALQFKITPDGDVLDVCASTDTGDLAFYLARPRLKGDLHGFGSILLAGAEVIRLTRNTPPPRQ